MPKGQDKDLREQRFTRRLAWYWRRVRMMTLPEAATRVTAQAITAYEWAFVKAREPRTQPPTTDHQPDASGFGCLTFDPSCVADYVAAVTPWLSATRSAARELVEHRHTLLGVNLTLPGQINWHLDPLTGNVAARHFSKRISYRFGSVSAKHIWELNRHQHWVTMARAGFLTKDRMYAQEVFRQWESWLDQNPPLVGINWASPLELAIRLVSWAYTAAFLSHTPWPKGLYGRTAESVRQQADHIARNLSAHSSANNHLVGEAAGLYVAGSYFLSLPGAARWRKLGKRLLIRTIRTQVTTEGIHGELAVGYHQFVFDLWLLAALVGRANGDEFPEDYWSRLQSMLDYLSQLVDAGGHLPQLGDSDDAKVVSLSSDTITARLRGQFGCGALLFRRSDFKWLAATLDESCIWLIGPKAQQDFESIVSEQPTRESIAYEASGVYVLRSHGLRKDERLLVFDAGPLGFGSMAAHGHADALSFTLSVSGMLLLVDPGTYTYHVDPDWRRYFKGTSAHNSIRVDGVDQSVDAGPTMWSRHAGVRLQSWNSSPTTDVVCASHDGYARLREPVAHSRCIIFRKDEDHILISDTLSGRGKHSVEVFLHFSPYATLRRLASHLVQAQLDSAESKVDIELDPSLTWRLAEGSVAPIGGWYSPQFGVKIPTTSIIGHADVRLPAKFGTRIRLTSTRQ